MSYVSDLKEEGKNAAPGRCQKKHPGEFLTCEEKSGHKGEHVAVRPLWTKMNPGYPLIWET